MAVLNSAALAALPDSVAVPQYDRSSVIARIVHFGVGAFHRSHGAMYVDRLLNAGLTDWGICGIGVLPGDVAMRDLLRAQDDLYTLVTKSPEGESTARIVGSIVQYLYAPDDPRAVTARLVDPETRIVSLTITEGGYGIDDATGTFDPRDEATLTDLADAASGVPVTAPRSVLGFLVDALRRRRDSGIRPFTVMSCDNIQGNGHIARIAVRGFAERIDPELATWIDAEVSFPNSMVDRITPATTDETRRSISADFGIDDGWPVRSESFEQWVLEDAFPLGRPPFERAGVQVVDDVEPYELMKLRMLNASHQAMSYLGILAGATYVHDVCTDPLFVGFLLDYMRHEAVPTLRPVPGIDLDEYADQLIARFGSDAILDTLARQVVDGSDRIPKFLLPVIRTQLAAGGDISRATLVLAAWSIFLEGRTEAGEPTPVSDRRLDGLRTALSFEQRQPGSFLDYASVLGDLGQSQRLRDAFVAARAELRTSGARAAIAARRVA